MERGTEYGLEQVYNVIDNRYRSRRPLIVTTNLSLQDIWRTSSRSIRLILSSIVSVLVSLKCAQTR